MRAPTLDDGGVNPYRRADDDVCQDTHAVEYAHEFESAAQPKIN